MRRTHQETQELIQARTDDFVNGDASDAVLKASLKALGLDEDEQKYYYWRAQVEKHSALTKENKP